MLILHIFSIFYQAGSQPYSSQDPSTLVPHAAIAHTPFSSAQDDVQSPAASHRQTTKKNHGLPWFFGLVSRVDLFLSGEAGLLEVHASGVNGMYPAFLMAILPSEDGDGDPGVHEDGVDEPVEVDLPRHLDLQENDQWDDRLDESQDRPELVRDQHIVVEDDREAGVEHIDVGHQKVEGRDEEEVVLQELHDAV